MLNKETILKLTDNGMAVFKRYIPQRELFYDRTY
jgi:hypothetical protein